jgi:hypothetical protein
VKVLGREYLATCCLPTATWWGVSCFAQAALYVLNSVNIQETSGVKMLGREYLTKFAAASSHAEHEQLREALQRDDNRLRGLFSQSRDSYEACTTSSAAAGYSMCLCVGVTFVCWGILACTQHAQPSTSSMAACTPVLLAGRLCKCTCMSIRPSKLLVFGGFRVQ